MYYEEKMEASKQDLNAERSRRLDAEENIDALQHEYLFMWCRLLNKMQSPEGHVGRIESSVLIGSFQATI